MQQQQLEEVLSWRLITELWRRFPSHYSLIETHPCSGMYDCLSLIKFDDCFHSILDVNRGGSVHIHEGRSPQSWPDWKERMLADPLPFLDEISDAIGADVPANLPKSTSVTISFRFICEFLTHMVGRLERWECRNGFYDTSGYGGGVLENRFSSFPAIQVDLTQKSMADGRLASAYGYWFLLKNSEPMLCLNTDGQLYKRSGEVKDLTATYAKYNRMWPVIAETALDLLP